MRGPHPSAHADYSAARLLLSAARRDPDRPALIDGASGRVWTTAVLVDTVRRAASWLAAEGVAEGERVAICAANSPLHLQLFLATQWLGGVFVPVPASASAPEYDYYLADCAPRVEVSDRGRGLSLAEVEAAIEASSPIAGRPMRLDDRLCAMVYTSGSTGTPRGVCLSAGALWWASRSFRDGFGYSPTTSVEMVCAPLSHIGGLNGTTIDILTGGGTVVVMPGFAPGPVLEAIERYRVTIMFAVPTMVRALLSHPDFSSRDVSSWVKPLIGGDALDPALRAAMCRAGLEPIHVWGMTETGGAGACLYPPVAAGHEVSVGEPFPFIDVELLDEDGAAITAPDRVGRVWVGGPGTMSGYWDGAGVADLPTREVRGVAMFDTGDVGAWDADGFLRILARAGRMILTGGEMVAPPEVEAALRGLEGVRDAAVVGVPDEYWGQRVSAVVVSETPLDLGLVREALGETLSGWKLPRALRRVDALPTKGNGKVDFDAVVALATRPDSVYR